MLYYSSMGVCMPVRIPDVVQRFSKGLSTCAILITLAACGGGSGSENTTSAPMFLETRSAAPIAMNASLSTLTQIDLAGIDSADVGLEFVTAEGTSISLVPNQSAPGRYWLPVVLAPVHGHLNVSVPNGTPVSMPIILVPYPTSGMPGEATQNFLQSSLHTINTAIEAMGTAEQPLPAMLEAIRAAREMSQQLLAWVNEAMQNGGATMVRLQDGTLMKITVDDLKVLDQLVLSPAMFAMNGGKPELLAHLSPVERLVDWFIPSAFAQMPTCQPDRTLSGIGTPEKNSTPNDVAWCLAMVQPAARAAFASRASATGEALILAADMTWHVGKDGSGAFRPGANAKAVSLAMVGLYTAHYGNALARMLALKDVDANAGEETAVQDGLKLLYKGVINEIQAPELNLDTWGKDDATAALITRTDAAIDKAGVENIITQIIDIFEARVAGIRLCADGATATPGSETALVTCRIQ